MVFRRLGSVLLAASLAMAPARVSLGAPAGNDEALVERARDLERRGEVLFKKKDYAPARDAFFVAWSLDKSWTTAGRLGECELKLGLYRDAAEHLAIFVRGKESEAPPVTEEMLELYFEARSKVGSLDVSVVGGPAEVLVDGEYVGTGPFEGPLFVEPGQHAVEARLARRAKAAVFGVKAGQTLRITMNFGVEPGWASVTIVDKESQEWDGIAAKPSGGVPEGNDPAAVEADATAVPAVAAPAQGAGVGREGQPNGYLVAGGTAAGGAAVGTGVALALLSAATASDADELLAQLKADGVRCSRPPQAGRCAELLSLRQEQDRSANTAMAALIGGGLLWAATAAYTFWPRPNTKPATVGWVAPVMARGGIGLSIGGAF
ncbi:uncharacterized protein SOCEGT47_054310 [Sorangium cellulosum]|uniref:PEGA domain-containing protein n=1 Tax=Sorangium cellulosum TaxID=56 RepID=A0A4P2Q6M8_SORCE|nr:uncharacterized protein SOCEGT47_054310 [Sorangium cellulosum]